MKKAIPLKEYYYDKSLHVQTGQANIITYPDSLHHNPYEPTPYTALEALFAEYELRYGSQVVDFGCGKGRLSFYLHHYHRVAVKGIEMDQVLLDEAKANLRSYLQYAKNRGCTIQFLDCLAEDYRITPEDTHFYFFNPFSVTIFQQVVYHILASVEDVKRKVDLILYYPNVEYENFLGSDTIFTLKREVVVPGLIEQDSRERFLVYGLE
ncbi:methionine biosynthesis protein MetW [Lentibacillus sp. N15]|uniref:SAM-dependent methyltransferase n=1 Tax=Lentibacillus songyuanensis TaxID=3136161 RepID=UPI0031B9EAB9